MNDRASSMIKQVGSKLQCGFEKGEPNATAKSYCEWVNEHLLLVHDLSAGFRRSISVHTATRWQRPLEFSPTSHIKGAFLDGHEHPDAYHREFHQELKELKDSHLPPPPCSDERPTNTSAQC